MAKAKAKGASMRIKRGLSANRARRERSKVPAGPPVIPADADETEVELLHSIENNKATDPIQVRLSKQTEQRVLRYAEARNIPKSTAMGLMVEYFFAKTKF